MVINSEFYPQSGLKHNGYAHQVEGYYQTPQKTTYAHMEEDYYAKDDCYNNNTTSSHINFKAHPHMTSTQPIKHGFVGQEGYAYQQGNNYFGGHVQKPKMHEDIHGGYGKSHYNHPAPTGHIGGYYGKHSNGRYETDEHESYTHMGPNRYESASYDYHVESPNNYAHKNKKNWAATGAEWISKGL